MTGLEHFMCAMAHCEAQVICCAGGNTAVILPVFVGDDVCYLRAVFGQDGELRSISGKMDGAQPIPPEWFRAEDIIS